MSLGNRSQPPIELLNISDTPSQLPFIIIPFQTFQLKCLIDTGSTRSFINPEKAELHFSKFIKDDPYIISTAHGTSKEKYSITIPCPSIFTSNKSTIKFHIFKFHKYFDCLLGIDSLQSLNATIDLLSKQMILPQTKIKINFKKLPDNNNYIKIASNTEKKIKIKIANVKNGFALLPCQIISELEIPESLIKIENNLSFISILNPTNKDISINLSNPFEVIPEDEFQIFNLNNFEHSNYKFDLTKVRLNHCNAEEKSKLTKLLNTYADIFHSENNALSFTNAVKHKIELKNETPIHTKTYRYPYVHKQEVQRQIHDMLGQGIIRPSQSAWSSPIWVVPKKLDASGKRKWRIVIDYRKLNEQTIDDRYPLPNINDILDKLGRSQYFTTLDLASGFHQIEIEPKDIAKTAFTVENGHYEFVRMPFGLKNAPSTFQRVMDSVLRGIQNECCIVYLDDIIIFSTSLQEHIQKLTTVFERLRQFNFKIQLDKSEFLQKEVNYLGHVITPNGIKPNPDKIKAILDFPIPRTPKELKSFLGLLGYYRKFIQNFAQLTKPMTSRLKKDNKIDINNSEYKNCFELCKHLLTNNPILQYPNFEEPFVLTTDASNYAIGAVLSQGLIGSDLPVAYASRTLNEHEINYSTIEKELLAIVWATKYFRPYLYGRQFNIVTDHKPLQWLFSLKEPNSKLVRWRLRLEEYDYKITYKKGKLNSNADALSRPPNLNIATSVAAESQKPIFQYINDFNDKMSTISIENPDDVMSIIVEPPDTTDQKLDDLDAEDDNTIHTNAENPICSIKISEDPLNFGKNQIKFISVKNNPAEPIILNLFENSKQRLIVQISKHNYKTDYLNFLKEYLVPNITYSCYFETDQLYHQLNSILQETMNNSINIKKCSKILEDVEQPDDQHNQIKNYHEGKCNHRGITETLQKLSIKYYWPNMQKTIQKYINDCDICKVVKYDRKPLKLKFNITPTPTKPFEIVHIDVLKYENHKFLTIIDAFSKYAQAYLLPNMQAIEIMKKLLQFFTHHSIPNLIITDNGSEFDNGLISDLLKLHKIDIHFCSPHHPASNGLIERLHSTLLEHINLLHNRPEFKNDSIDLKFLYALVAYNNSIHSTTKLTPFNILNFDMQDLTDIDLESQILNNFIQSHKEKLQILYKEINNRLSENKEKIISKLNKNREEIPVLPEKVFIKSNFRSKQRNRFKQEKILQVNPSHKTIKVVIDKKKTGRKFSKLHIDNIKRPNKTLSPIPGTSSSFG